MNKKEESFGDYLRNYRESSKISLRKLAEEAELDPAYLSRIERGEIKRPGREIIEQIAVALCRKQELQETECDKLNRDLLLMAEYKLSDADLLGLKPNQSISIEELFAQRLIERGLTKELAHEVKKAHLPHEMTKVLNGEVPINIKNIKNIDNVSKSRIRNLQSIGRGLRLGDNKINAAEDSSSDNINKNLSKLKTGHARQRSQKIKERKFQAGARAFIQVDGELTTSQEEQLRALTALVRSILKIKK